MKVGTENPRDHGRDGRGLHRGSCEGAAYVLYWQRLDEVLDDAEEGAHGWSSVITRRDWCVDYPALCCETFDEAEEAARRYATEETEAFDQVGGRTA